MQRGYGYEWQTISREVRADNPVCQVCRAQPSAQVHHRISIADGGTNERFNLVAVCGSCHQRLTWNKRRTVA